VGLPHVQSLVQGTDGEIEGKKRNGGWVRISLQLEELHLETSTTKCRGWMEEGLGYAAYIEMEYIKQKKKFDAENTLFYLI